MSKNKIKTYREFWDFYVSEHSNPLNRLLHFVGTSLGMVLLVWFLASGQFLFIPLCFVVGYGFAWFGHFVVRKINLQLSNIRCGHLFPITEWLFIC